MPDLSDRDETTVTRLPPRGMITLRADLADPATAAALAPAGVPVPDVRAMMDCDAGQVGWMSPDELLVLCPSEQAGALLHTLGDAMTGLHALVADVSDARAIFAIAGPRAREVLAQLCPVDLDPAVFGGGELRRTRLAQIPAAFWMTGPQAFELICFRSVADYAGGVLTQAAHPDRAVGLWPDAR